MTVPLVVGFDLDMTLAASDDGIVATLVRTGAELGVRFDEDDLRRTIGLPLDHVLRSRIDAALVGTAVSRYRELYPTVGIPSITAMAGAPEAVAAVRAPGGRTLVISAKITAAVEAVLEHLGIEVDVVVGGRFGAEKGQVLLEHGASAYVGDHPGDVLAAKVAGAVAVAVPTGPSTVDELRAAGADVILPSLRDFPAWLAAHTRPERIDHD